MATLSWREAAHSCRLVCRSMNRSSMYIGLPPWGRGPTGERWPSAGGATLREDSPGVCYRKGRLSSKHARHATEIAVNERLGD